MKTMKFRWIVFLSLLICLHASPASADAKESLASYQEIVWNYLKELDGFGPRFPGGPGYGKMQDLIAKTGEQYADEIREQKFAVAKGENDKLIMTNFELIFRGQSEGAPIVIGVHYDTRPYADNEFDPRVRNTPIPGANDGGSGTALLLGLARYLDQRPPVRTVKLVFFDGEDYGKKDTGQMLLGSTVYTAELEEKGPGSWPALVLVVDMIGDKNLEIYKENNSQKSAPWLVDYIFQVARENNVSQFREKFRHSIYDDHTPFHRLGIPSVLLIDFDYPYWHRLNDTLDKCSPESLFAVFSVVVKSLEGMETLLKSRQTAQARPGE